MRFLCRDILVCLSLAVLCLGFAMPAVAQKDIQKLTEAVDPGTPVQKPINQGTGRVVEGTLTFYMDRATFDAAFPGLPIEDFEEGNVAPGGVEGCPAPLDQNSNNLCFSPGDILPDVSFSNGPVPNGVDGIALLGAGFLGAPSKNVVANFFVDDWRIDFPNSNVFAAGMDVVCYLGGASVSIDIYGPAGILGSTTSGCSAGGTFWGVSSTTTPITQIVMFDAGNGAEGCDNIAFGAGAAPTMGPTAMLLLALLLIAGSTFLLRRRQNA